MGLQLSVLAGAATAASGTKKTEVTGVDDPTGATAATATTGAPSTEQQQLQQMMQLEEEMDQCGIDADWDSLEPWVQPPRIKETQLTPEEKAKFRGHLDIIFDQKSLAGRRIAFDPQDVLEVFMKVRVYLKSEPMLIEDLPFDITVVADIHGQLYDLHRVFHCDEKDGKPGWECMKYLFLGNYVGRGRHSIEVIVALFCLKMLYPDRIFLLRGNHEFLTDATLECGFIMNFPARYEFNDALLLYLVAQETFGFLSVAAIIGNTYFCAHGGISPAAFTRQQFRGIFKPMYLSTDDLALHQVIHSEPAQGLRGHYAKGESIYFGFDTVCHALECMQVKVVIRGHTKLKTGYAMIWQCLLSIFTSTAVDEELNDGAVAVVDARGKLAIRVLKVIPERTAWEKKLRGGEPMEPFGASE